MYHHRYQHIRLLFEGVATESRTATDSKASEEKEKRSNYQREVNRPGLCIVGSIILIRRERRQSKVESKVINNGER